MSLLRPSFVSGAVPSLSALLFVLGGCNSGSSTGSTGQPSYTLSATALNPASITAGNASTSTITVTPANGYTGSISLSCGMISGGTGTPSCSFSTSAVTISSASPGTSMLTVTTSSSTPGGNYTISVIASDAKNLAPSNGPQSLTLTTAAVFQHIVVIFQENRTPDNLFQDPVLIDRGADIALLVIDATEGVTGQDQRLAERIEASGCPIVVLLNKWDTITDPDERAALLAELGRRLAFLGEAPVLKVSALTGKTSGSLTSVDRWFFA